jgi:hypothetical protein
MAENPIHLRSDLVSAAENPQFRSAIQPWTPPAVRYPRVRGSIPPTD